MIKQTKAEESGFDILSQERFVDTIVETEETTPASKDKEDALTNQILKKVADGEKAGKKEAAAKTEEEEVADEVLAKEEKKSVDKKGKKEDPAKDADSLEDEEKEEEQVPAAGKKDDKKTDKKDGEETDEEGELSFDDDTTPAPKAEDGELENTWINTAKELGYDIKEDTFDAFKKVISEKAETNTAKFKPETQRLIKFAEAGGTVDDFVEPFSKIDKVLGMADADLAMHHFKIKKWNEDKAQAKIEAMAESGELEPFVAEIRESLDTYREETKQRIIDDRIKAQELHEQKVQNAYKDEAKTIKAALDTKKDFMGTSLKDNNREKIFKKYENGDYEESFKDPDFIADFLLYKEYGERAIGNLKEKLSRDVKKEYKNDRHNVPPKTGKAGAVQRQTSGHDSDPFDVLESERVK